MDKKAAFKRRATNSVAKCLTLYVDMRDSSYEEGSKVENIEWLLLDMMVFCKSKKISFNNALGRAIVAFENEIG